MKNTMILVSGMPGTGKTSFAMSETLDKLMEKYRYNTITIHMDTAVDIAYRRFHERNQNEASIERLRPKEIPFNAFVEGTKQNKNFRYGEKIVIVNTDDFSKISYEDIFKSICEL